MSGKRVVTFQLLLAIRKLAELSTKYRSTGIPFVKKDWEEGRKKLETQDREAWKMLKPFELRHLKQIWTKYQNAAYGYCASTHCPNKVNEGEFYCKTCKPGNQAVYHRGLYSLPAIRENRIVVKRVVQAMDERELKKIVLNNIDNLKFRTRKELLGEAYLSQLTENKKK